MRLFVTGGTGFIGQHVVHALHAAGHELLLLTLADEDLSRLKTYPGLLFFQGNLADIEPVKTRLEAFKPEAVVHLAWEGIPNYDYQTSTKNLFHSLRLMNVLAELGCEKVLCTGSCWEYGEKIGQLREDSPVKASTPFTAAKISLQTMGREIAKANAMDFLWVRLFYVYGPGQKSHSLIPHIITAIRSGKSPEIKTPRTRNDFVYVEDVASAITALVGRKTKADTFNIGSGVSTEISDIITMVYRFYDVQQRFTPPAKTTDTPVNFWADITRIQSETGWKPRVPVEEGIRRTVEFWKTTPL